ncbi:hypothetical protein [Ruegeria sp. HKCCA6948]|uniref:hypothetical protein n=1 Tax=Ruegeria sp. HKCCA6948 TaxID=2682997 RepID=UPI001487C501|nr:hypothetical protein [Ruegeria sp. HKCCA6948]
MLVFKAFPLSFSILWRFVLVFPVMLVALFLYGLAGGLVGLLINLLLSGLYFIVFFFISVSSAVIPILVGNRLGFLARNMTPRGGYKKLVAPALMYGATEAILGGLLLAPIIGLQLTTSLTGLSNGFESAPVEPLSAVLSEHNPVVALIVILGFSAVRALLMVPMAAAALGLDPNDRPYTPFRNIGKSFLPLFSLITLSYVLMVVLIIAAGIGFAAYADGNPAFANPPVYKADPSWSNMIAVFQHYWVIVVAVFIIGIWTLSLQCAGGVLAYLKLRGGGAFVPMPETKDQPLAAAPFGAQPSGPRMSAEDLRALRKSREFRDS